MKDTNSRLQKAIFFDRDGVINSLLTRDDDRITSPWNINEFKFLPGVFEAVNIVQTMGYATFIVTNQPAIEDGNMTHEQLHEIHDMLSNWLSFDDIMYAHERNSDQYKPKNGMLENLIEKHGIDREKSYIIGDRWKDIVPGHLSGINTIYVGEIENYKPPEEYKDIKPNYYSKDIHDACLLIVEKR